MEQITVIFYRSKKGLKYSGDARTTIEIVKFDTLWRIISGRFDSIIISAQYTDRTNNQFVDSIVHITQGRFDIKYGTNF